MFKFSTKYPFESPVVSFVGSNIPIHPHVYSNGHICLSILTDDWSPALSVQSVCLSIISMLSSCKEKKRPPDNSIYVRTCNKNPKKTKVSFDDPIRSDQIRSKTRHLSVCVNACSFFLLFLLQEPAPKTSFSLSGTSSSFPHVCVCE